MTRKEEHILEAATTFARERMRGLHSSHGWDHVERVRNLADKIAATEQSADPFIVAASALLHDIARSDEIESGGKDCHAEMGGRIAYEFLTGSGCSIKKAELIRTCIRSHRYRNDHSPETIEAKILYDADKLDSIGAVGVGRAFLFSGEVGARLHNPDINAALAEAYSKEDTAYREYLVKLRFIRDGMLTCEGNRLADKRHRFMVEFFNRLRDEVGGVC